MSEKESNMVSMKVDDSVVEAVVAKQIQAGIVMQLGNQEDLIAKAVTGALKVKVNSSGIVDKSGYYNDYDFLETLTTKAIHAAARDAFQTWLESNAEKVKAAVIKELKKPSRQRSIAVAFANAVEDSLKCDWRMNCDVTFDKASD